jgi:hypothetical protein
MATLIEKDLERFQNKIKYRELPRDFEGKGEVSAYNFKQVFKNDKWYIYHLTREGKVSHFEVFKRQERLAGGYALENYIAYPRSKAFGLWAWTTKTLEEANQLIIKKQIKK